MNQAFGVNNEASSHHSLAYRPDIDGLRALAVLAVVGFHAFPNWFKGGFIGVDVFFVISGYLISAILFKDLAGAQFSFINFYTRRIRRIFPALIIVLFFSLDFGWFMLFQDEYAQLGKHILGGVGFISNYLFWQESGYFDTAAETKPLLHLWSLGIEEQFYIFWPLLLWLAWKSRLNLLALIILGLILSFSWNMKSIYVDVVATFYSPQTRFWELFSGAILAYLHLHEAKNTHPLFLRANHFCSRYANALSGLGLILIISGLIFITSAKHFPGKWALFPVVGSFLIIATGQSSWLNRKILSHRVLVEIGLISFPLYLWHWPILAFLRIILGEQPSLGVRIGAVFLAIVLAWLTYRFIERPIRFHLNKTVINITLVVFMGLVAVGGGVLFLNPESITRASAKEGLDLKFQQNFPNYGSCTEPILIEVAGQIGCKKNISKEPNAVIFGDSHAIDKYSGLIQNDPNNTWRLIGINGCPPVMGIGLKNSQSDCETKSRKAIEWIANNKNIQLVDLAFYGNVFLEGSYAFDHLINHLGPENFKFSLENNLTASRAEIFYEGLNNSIRYLLNHGKKVIISIDVPELPFSPRDCLRNYYKNCELDYKEVENRQLLLRQIIDELKTSNPAIIVFDPMDIVCNGDKCSFIKNGHSLYRDSHHLSWFGASLYGKLLVESFNK